MMILKAKRKSTIIYFIWRPKQLYNIFLRNWVLPAFAFSAEAVLPRLAWCELDITAMQWHY